MKALSVKHSGAAGDIIYSLPALLSLRSVHQIDHVTYYLQLNEPHDYVAPHPLGKVLLDASFAAKLKPLLLTQPYIDAVEIYSGQPLQVDFDLVRRIGLNPCTYSVPRWYFLFVAGTNWDVGKPWLQVEPDPRFRDYALVGRNARLRSPHIRYDFMNEFADRLVFVGVQEEYEEFRAHCPRCTRFYEAPDFLELARILAGCKFFAGNQGLLYTLAEALKIPRLLETNLYAANNIPQGGECYEALFQQGFEFWCRRLLSR